MHDRLLTAREVADQLSVCPDTVLRWYRRGELPAIKLPGGAIRFQEDALNTWLKDRATPPRGVLTATQDAARPQTVASSVLTVTDHEED